RRQHAHVVRGRLANDLAARTELGTAKDIAAAHDNRELDAAQEDALRLPGYAHRLIDADATLAAVPKPFPAELQDHALIPGFEGLDRMMIVHGVFHREWEGHALEL